MTRSPWYSVGSDWIPDEVYVARDEGAATFRYAPRPYQLPRRIVLLLAAPCLTSSAIGFPHRACDLRVHPRRAGGQLGSGPPSTGPMIGRRWSATDSAGILFAAYFVGGADGAYLDGVANVGSRQARAAAHPRCRFSPFPGGGVEDLRATSSHRTAFAERGPDRGAMALSAIAGMARLRPATSGSVCR